MLADEMERWLTARRRLGPETRLRVQSSSRVEVSSTGLATGSGASICETSRSSDAGSGRSSSPRRFRRGRSCPSRTSARCRPFKRRAPPYRRASYENAEPVGDTPLRGREPGDLGRDVPRSRSGASIAASWSARPSRLRTVTSDPTASHGRRRPRLCPGRQRRSGRPRFRVTSKASPIRIASSSARVGASGGVPLRRSAIVGPWTSSMTRKSRPVVREVALVHREERAGSSSSGERSGRAGGGSGSSPARLSRILEDLDAPPCAGLGSWAR